MPQDSAHEFVFFIDTIKQGEPQALISGGEHHHLSRVLKAAIGQEVFVTDGRGSMYRGRVSEIGRDQTTVDIIADQPVEAPARRLTLALGRIRKDRFSVAVEQCTELGVMRFVPFHSRKCHHHPYSSNFMERLNRIAQAAVKQSFQAIMPIVESERGFDALLEMVQQAGTAIVGKREAPGLTSLPRVGSILIIVGPEGGFLQEELDELERRGAVFATVAPARLRSETAAVSMVSQALLVSD
jgi:16S rRNA (uracil1498-N3)-methyltransferase